MEIGPARLAAYLVQLAVMVSGGVEWQLERIPASLAVRSMVLLAAALFLTIYADNQNEKRIKALSSDLKRLGQQVKFLMRSHRQRRKPRG
jgi:hypothetical protein